MVGSSEDNDKSREQVKVNKGGGQTGKRITKSREWCSVGEEIVTYKGCPGVKRFSDSVEVKQFRPSYFLK